MTEDVWYNWGISEKNDKLTQMTGIIRWKNEGKILDKNEKKNARKKYNRFITMN